MRRPEGDRLTSTVDPGGGSFSVTGGTDSQARAVGAVVWPIQGGVIVPPVTIPLFEPGTERSTRGGSDCPMSWEPFAVRDQLSLDEIRAAPLARIVTVTISVATPREGGQHKWLVVEREKLCGPVDRSDWLVLLPESPDREAGGDSAAREWQEAFDRWAAKELVKPVWEQTTEHWDLSGGHDMASIADGLGSLQDQWHQLMLGKQVQFASEIVGLPSPASAVLSRIVSEHALPGDTAITDLKRIVQITGIVASFATENLHMAYTCLASYTRDRVTEAVSQQVAKLFTPEPEKLVQPSQRHYEIPVIISPPGRPLSEPLPSRTELVDTEKITVITNKPGTSTDSARPTHVDDPSASARSPKRFEPQYMILPEID